MVAAKGFGVGLIGLVDDLAHRIAQDIFMPANHWIEPVGAFRQCRQTHKQGTIRLAPTAESLPLNGPLAKRTTCAQFASQGLLQLRERG